MGREREEAGRTVRPHSSDPCEGKGRGEGTREGKEEGKRTRREAGGGRDSNKGRRKVEARQYCILKNLSARLSELARLPMPSPWINPQGTLGPCQPPQTQVITYSSLTHFFLAFRRPHTPGFPPTSLVALL